MKILLVSPYYIDSYQNHLTMGSAVKLSRNISSMHQVKVLTTGRKINRETVNSNLEVISLPGWLIRDPVNYMISPQLLIAFTGMLDSYRPDLVIVSKYMFFSSFVIPIARIKGYKVITVTDTFPGINWFSQSKLTSAVMWLYARIIGVPLLKMSHRVVVLYSGLEEIAKKYGLKFETIPNGIEPEFFKSLPKPKYITKPKGEFWIGFIGRPESAKGFTTVLEIARRLQPHKHIKIIIVGGSCAPHPDENKIYLGFQKNTMELYQLFDLFILPSRAEGLPNVVMESMAQGTPVIASGVGGVNYLIKNMENGILVGPQDAEGFVKNIRLLEKNPHEMTRLSIAAKNTIVKNFNWDRILISYNQLFEKLCAE